MRSSLLFVAAGIFVACTSGGSGIGAGDGGSGDGGASSCTPQPENVRASLCDATTKNTLYACDQGSPPPASDCTKTVQANAYCCPGGGSTTEDGGGTTPGDAGMQPTGTNPYGVPYPTDNIGWKARSGSARGDRIKNVTLPGYKPNTSTQTQVSMADLYDPQKKTHDVVVIIAGALWENIGAKSLQTAHASTKRVAVLAVVGEGPTPGQAATTNDLGKWHTQYPWATTALDASFKEFGSAFDAAALPWIAFIDARTMEIVSSAVGGISSTSELDAAVDAVANGPAKY